MLCYSAHLAPEKLHSCQGQNINHYSLVEIPRSLSESPGETTKKRGCPSNFPVKTKFQTFNGGIRLKRMFNTETYYMQLFAAPNASMTETGATETGRAQTVH